MIRTLPFLLLLGLLLTACQDDDDLPEPVLELPATYTFERAGMSTVSFDGQTTRIAMAEALVAALLDTTRSESDLLAMFRNAGPNGEDVSPFVDAALNASDKSLRSKVAASADYFSANATDATAIRTTFDSYPRRQASEVYPAWNTVAQAGQAGQVADGTSTRYVNAGGLEYNQAFAKSLLGALMLDQTLNNYLSPSVLDEARNRENQSAGVTEDGAAYTTMEHKWDEAYGYVFGASPTPATPLTSLGDDDSFLNEYLDRVDQDDDFSGIAEDVFRAFLRGRAAIVADDFTERDQQANRIQELLSRVIAVRATFYLARGSTALESANGPSAGFHALSEAYGFVYSLQFTRDPATGAPYFSRAEVGTMLDSLYGDYPTGFWAVEPATVRELGQQIADRFAFSYTAAAN
ncbi:hypothetical protein LEM8419_01213 [Neolewinella maritima]|uniref:DUF4856 domain-containing protein n=1 Tax=Neolewinella maritima TaxID=1383882 RepID=A0ABN8F0K0_9BACT|nr:DUF4856 domain-containing protein [Neolewinella maritima]CAH1000008.1 hypothetical protein LEM8419_01213 [Neolewinella maritima]